MQLALLCEWGGGSSHAMLCAALGRATLRTIIVSSTLKRLCTYKYTQFRTVIVQSECIRGVFHVNYYFSKHTLCVQDIRVALQHTRRGVREKSTRARTERSSSFFSLRHRHCVVLRESPVLTTRKTVNRQISRIARSQLCRKSKKNKLTVHYSTRHYNNLLLQKIERNVQSCANTSKSSKKVIKNLHCITAFS